MNRTIFYKPTNDESAMARVVAKIRNTKNSGQSNLHNRKYLTKEQMEKQHYRAILAEIAVSRLTNLCWTGAGKGGVDVGGMIEVRSTTSPNYGLLIRQTDIAKGEKDNPYVLVFVANGICQFLGWAFIDDALSGGWILDPNTNRPAHVLNQDKLKSFDELLEYIKTRRENE